MTLQRDLGKDDIKGLNVGRGEPERAVAATDEVKPAPLEQGERDGSLVGALAPLKREIGGVGTRGDGVVDRSLP